MADLSTGTLSVNIQPFLDQLGLGEKQANQLAQAAQAAGDATTKSFAAAAAEAVNYANRVAAGAAEVRNAQAATKSAADEVRRLADANRELVAAQKASTSTAEYNRLKGLIAENTAKIREAKAAILENKQATDQERASVQAVRDARREETNQTKLVAAAAKDAAAAAKLEAQAQKEAGAATASAGQSGGFLSTVFGKVAGAFAGLFAVNKLKQLGEDIIATTVEFERMEAVLTTINNGNNGKAQREFAELREFAIKNPFEIGEITEGYVKLRNVGINPTIAQLQALGDLAAASGKSFETVSDGLLGATTGRFVQLKQFGITAKQQGDTVALTFRGVTTVVEKSQAAISDYIFGLGRLNGVVGATERIMDTTGGRISNLKDSFTELFATIGKGNTGVINNFITGLGQITDGVTNYFKSINTKALEGSATSAKIFETVQTERFARVAELAKKNGQDLNQAVGDFARQQDALIVNQLRKANADLAAQQAARKTAEAGLGLFPTAAEKKQNLEDRDIDRQKEQAIRTRIELLKTNRSTLTDLATKTTKGNTDELNELGLLAAARAKLAADEKLREENQDKTKSHTLNLLIIADQKVIDDLLEKQEKKRKAREYSYEAQLRALLQERAALTSLAAKAAIDSADDAGTKAKSAFDEALRGVDAIKAKLEQREADLAKAARKAGGGRAVAGLGEKADGQIDGVQAQQLTALRLAALDKYYTDLYKITAEREQRLFDLQADSDQKQIEAIDRQYDERLKKAKDAQEREAVELARQREQLALQAQQTQKRSDATATLATAIATTVGNVFGEGTGISEIDAKRTEKRALLEIERKHAEDILNNSLLLGNKEGELARAQAQATLAQIRQDLAAVDREKASHKAEDFMWKLILGENDSDENRAKLTAIVDEFKQAALTVIHADEQAAQAKIDSSNQRINELQSGLAAEIQLNKEGSASNIQTILNQIAEEKQARKDAVEAKKKAQREEAIINGLQQASALATAAANLILGWSELPIVGQVLGALSVAAMLATFLATKSAASSAASATGYFTGGFTPEGGKYEAAGTVHKGEFVANQELTRDYRTLFAALHTGRPQDIQWDTPAMRQLLPNHELPNQLRAERAEAQRHQIDHSFSPLKSEFGQMHSRLEAIERSNQQMADKWDSHTLPDGRIALIDPTTKSIHVITPA
jgi:hypothetical protein